MVDTIAAFLFGGPSSIPGGTRNFNFYPGTGCISFACVPSCVVSGGCSVIADHASRKARLCAYACVLVYSLLLPLGRAQTNLTKLLLAKALLLKTCFLLLKIRHGAHQSSKKKKCFRARFGKFEQKAFCSLHLARTLLSVKAFCYADVLAT